MTENNGEKTEDHEYQEEPGGKFKEGNPGGGRPEGRKNFRTLFWEAIESIAESEGIEGMEDKTPEQLQMALVKRGLMKALDGDYHFYEDTLDRLMGKPQKSMDVTSGGEKIEGNTIQLVGFNEDEDNE